MIEINVLNEHSSRWDENQLLIGIDRLDADATVDTVASANAGEFELFGSLFDDNTSTSTQCTQFCMSCPDDQSLWWIVLRWMKIVFLKAARSYHAKPFLLALIPLTIGIAIGYVIGVRRKQCLDAHVSSKPMRAIQPTIWMQIQQKMMSFFFRISSEYAWPFLSKGNDDNNFDELNDNVSENVTSARLEAKNTNLSHTLQQHEESLDAKEEGVRSNLKSTADTLQESGLDASQIPLHVAVIMDGNRRYGKAKYGNVSKGHWDGSSKLVEFAKWCIAEKVSVLTVYAFSTENWNRDPSEVASLMAIFAKYCDELRIEALQRNIRIHVLSTETSRIPSHVQNGLNKMTSETAHCTGLTMNICMSYGSRGEIVRASRLIAADVSRGILDVDKIQEHDFEKHLLTNHCGDPDVLLRTSGEIRISNFLCWQLAYTEMFFVDKPWPAIEKKDFLRVLQSYGQGRMRRYGK